MTRFVHFIDHDGDPVYLNPNHVTVFYAVGVTDELVRVHLVDSTSIRVRGTVEDVVSALTATGVDRQKEVAEYLRDIASALNVIVTISEMRR